MLFVAAVPDPLKSFINQVLATTEPPKQAIQPKSIQHYPFFLTQAEHKKMASSGEEKRKMIYESFLRTVKNLKGTPYGKPGTFRPYSVALTSLST